MEPFKHKLATASIYLKEDTITMLKMRAKDSHRSFNFIVKYILEKWVDELNIKIVQTTDQNGLPVTVICGKKDQVLEREF